MPRQCQIDIPHNRHDNCDGAPQLFCASSPEAQALPEVDFWDHVFRHHMDVGEHTDNCEAEVDHILGDGRLIDIARSQPCSECGAHTACSYDAEGRPLVHVERDDSEGE